MSTKPWHKPEKLAEARFHDGERHTYDEMAEYLGCSKGTISVYMDMHGDEVAKYSPEDFAEERDPTTLSPQEIRDRVARHLDEEWDVDYREEDGGIVCDTFDLFVIPIRGQEDAIETLGNRDESLRFFADWDSERIDQHRRKRVVNRAGYLEVLESGFAVMREPMFDQDSFGSFIFEEERPELEYGNPVWLRYQVEEHGLSAQDLSEKCSVRVDTVRSRLQRYGIPT